MIQLFGLCTVWIMNGVSMLTRKPSKTVWILLILILAVFFAYVPVDTTPMDTAVYQRYFDNLFLIPPTFESGYISFYRWMSSTGMTYWTFRLLIAFIGFGSYTIMLFRLKLQQSWFWFFYPLIPFLEDAIQLRNFLMLACVALAVACLAPKRHPLFALGFLLLGAQFQSSGYFYFGSLIMYLLWDKEKIRNRILLVFILLFLVMLVGSLRSFVSSAMSSLDLTSFMGDLSDKASMYLGRNALNRIVFADFVYAVGNLVLFFFGCKIIENQGTSFTDREAEVIKVIGAFLVSAILILPLLPLAYNFDRIVKNSFIFMFAFTALFFEHIKFSKYRDYWLTLATVFVYFVGYFVAYYLLASNDRYILEVVPILTQNTLLGN